MTVYRVCSSSYADLDGEGARKYGGRWNSPGLAVVYTADSLALAILETRVHLRRMPVDYVSLAIEIRDSAFAPHEVPLAELDSNWRYDPVLTSGIGDTHFVATPMIPLKVPSVVVESEWNILFSPDYAAAYATIVDKQSLTIDSRLWDAP